MANFIFTQATKSILDGDIDPVNDTLRVMVLMTNNSCVADRDTADFLTNGNLTTLDEYDGSGYSRQDLASQSTDVDTGNNRTEFTAGVVTFGSAVGAGTRQAAGVLVYKFITNDDASIPLGYFDDDSNLPLDGTGSAFKVTFNADGLWHLTAS